VQADRTTPSPAVYRAAAAARHAGFSVLFAVKNR
jgi:hypothetical protein